MNSSHLDLAVRKKGGNPMVFCRLNKPRLLFVKDAFLWALLRGRRGGYLGRKFMSV